MVKIINAPFRNAELPLEARLDDLLSKLTLDEKIGLMPTRQESVTRLGIPEYWVGGEAAHGLVAREGPTTVFPQTIGLSSTWDTELLHEIGNIIGDEARSYYKQRGGMGGLTVWAPTVDMERDPRWGRTEEAYGEDPCLTSSLAVSLIRGMQGDHPFYIKLVPALKHFYANNNEKDRLSSSSSIDPRNKREYYLKAFERAITEARVHSLMTAYNEINGIPAIAHPDIKNILKGEWQMDGYVVCDGADMHQTVDDHQYCDTYAEAVALAIRSGIDCITDDSELVKRSIREALEQGLLEEGDLDQAIRNVFRIRFRLGQFDPDELNPYASIPESVIHKPEHRQLALKAAREAIVLLQNKNGMLPLQKEHIHKAAVLGPLADTVYRDWYTGIHPYKITPLQGIVGKLSPKPVLFKDCSDRVTLKSAWNQCYLGTKAWDNGTLLANRAEAHSPEAFKLTDWGWGSHTLRSCANGGYMTTNDETGAISAAATDIWGWFVKELFDFVPREDGTITIRTWNGRTAAVAQSGEPSLILDQAEACRHDAESFIMETVTDGIKEAVQAAKEAEVAVVCVGNHPLINGKEEMDRPGLALPESQERLIREVYAANPNTVVVIIGSYPFALSDEVLQVPAIVYTAHGCQELGSALSDVLFGDYNPAGRLSMTWYRSEAQLPDMMNYDIIKGKRTYQYFEGEPLYPFGYGLSYSSFRYNGLQVSKQEANADEEVTVSLKVENIGIAAGDEVVQLYVRADRSRVIRPLKQLIAFKRIHLLPGEAVTVTFIVKIKEWAYWDVTRDRYCVEAGSYTIMAGASSADIRESYSITVDGEIVPPRDLTRMTRAENYDDYEGIYLDEAEDGGACVTVKQDHAWIVFRDVDLSGKRYMLEARVLASGECSLAVRNEHPLGTTTGCISLKDSQGSWVTVQCPINLTAAGGVQDLYLCLNGLLQISRFQLIPLIG